jgi:cobalt-zinc-cadmium efflux system membrane fusion protein
VSNVATVWVQGHINDMDLTAVRVGDAVEETSSSLPGAFEGRVSYIGAMLDPTTRTTPVRVVTRNRGDLLKKDLFVDLVIHSATRRGVLAVPTSAVLYNTENLPFVYVQVQPGKFAQRLVKKGRRSLRKDRSSCSSRRPTSSNP